MVGTNHVAGYRAEARVQEAIRELKPKLVMLELCKKRKHLLDPEKKGPHRDGNCCAACMNICQLSLTGNGSVALLGYLMSRYLRRVGQASNTTPGKEFRAAAKEARRQRASLILGDRDFTITLMRIWARLGVFERIALCWKLFYGAYLHLDFHYHRRLSTEDSIRLMGKQFPGILGPLVSERDAYMAHVLRFFVDQGETIVAVVGDAHVKGIQKKWKDNIDVQKLLTVPQVHNQIIVFDTCVI
mmetsp:Transcript_8563/g.16834  ORF Transcript_8563/g.16834 Transcript_8563/m.16834 type:complete len:243 (-) Transcript_8563:332-1060(-)